MNPNNQKILFLEPNQTEAQYLIKAFSAHYPFELECIHAYDVRAALKHLETNSINLLLLNLCLPGEKGLDVFRSIHKKWPLVPIVVVTDKESEDGIQALHEGARDYLIKKDLSGPVLSRLISYVIQRNKFEEAVKKGEEQLKLFIEHAPAAIAMLDRNLNYLVISRRWVEDFKLQSQNIIGKNHYDVFPEIPDRWKEVLNCALEGQVQRSEEDFFIRADQTIQWVRWEVRPWYERRDVIGGVVIFMEVITEKKKALEALAESEKRFRTYFNLSLLGIAIISPLKGWLEVNDKLCELLGYSRDELKSMTWVELTYPEDLVQDLKHFDLLFSGKVDSYSLSKRFIRKNGDMMHASTNIRCVRKSDGSVDYFVALVQDITDQVRIEHERIRSEQKYKGLYNSSRDGILFLNMNGNIIDANPAFLEMIGYSREEVIGVNQFHITPPQWHSLERDIIKNQISMTGYSPIYEKEFRRKDGSATPVTVRMWISKESGLTAGMWCTVHDISERKKTQEQLTHLSYYDVLTDLPNRMLFVDRLQQAIIAARYAGTAVAILFIGLDHFKRVNDTLGRTVGDHLLQEVAKRLKTCLEEMQTVTRVAGDEFAVLLPNVEKADDAINICNQIFFAFKEPFKIDDHELFLSCCIGISLFPTDGKEPEILLRNANAAMDRAKGFGRNQYRLYSATMHEKTHERFILENSLRHAVDRNELCLVYQPQINLSTGDIMGVEALVRWKHPELGLITPTEFLPLAEETGLIVSIDDWVMREACLQAKKWLEMGFSPIRMAVNLTARQFQYTDVVDSVKKILRETSLSPYNLEIELTEHVIMQNVEETVQCLKQLSDMGVKISIDDFGTGYSSLSYLKRFPIHSLKIDEAFVRDITTDPDDAAIVKAIISLAHHLKLEVVAENVETEPQRMFLKTEQCDRMQGFLYSRPVAPNVFTDLLTTQNKLV
nr:Diguanylate cyclase/phosphodiesterase (GGDEF & EAL domains) with PAS/PAC sensor(S) precursor [uncultured bacterium]